MTNRFAETLVITMMNGLLAGRRIKRKETILKRDGPCATSYLAIKKGEPLSGEKQLHT